MPRYLGGFGSATEGAGVHFQPQGELSPLQGFALWTGISMVSADEGRAVGGEVSSFDAGQQDVGGLILHYVGGHWTAANSPTKEVLEAIAMASPSDGWAVGHNGVVLHYSRGRWAVAAPSGTYPIAYLQAIALVSPTEWWAVGEGRPAVGENSFGAHVHYVAGRWTFINGDSVEVGAHPLFSISMVSPSEGWALGSASYGPALVHFQNGQWNVDITDSAAIGQQGEVGLQSVDMLSPNDGWAVGAFGIAHYCGGKWAFKKVGVALRKVAMVSPTEGWAVGSTCCTPKTDHGVILHYQRGSWALLPSPLVSTQYTGLADVSMASRDDGWAIGGSGTSNDPILLRYHNGTWNIYNG